MLLFIPPRIFPSGLFDNAFIFIYSVLLYIETRDFIMVPTTKPIREEFYAYVCLS